MLLDLLGLFAEDAAQERGQDGVTGLAVQRSQLLVDIVAGLQLLGRRLLGLLVAILNLSQLLDGRAVRVEVLVQLLTHILVADLNDLDWCLLSLLFLATTATALLVRRRRLIVLALLLVRLLLLLVLLLAAVTTIAVIAAATASAVTISALVVVVVATVTTTAATTTLLTLALLTSMLVLDLLSDFLTRLGTVVVHVLSSLPARSSVSEHVLDEQLDTHRQLDVGASVRQVLQLLEALDDVVELLRLVLLLAVFLEAQADLVHEVDGAFDDEIVDLRVELADAEQCLEDVAQSRLRQDLASEELADELVVAEELLLEHSGLLEVIQVLLALLFRQAARIGGSREGSRVRGLLFGIKELGEASLALVEEALAEGRALHGGHLALEAQQSQLNPNQRLTQQTVEYDVLLLHLGLSENVLHNGLEELRVDVRFLQHVFIAVLDAESLALVCRLDCVTEQVGAQLISLALEVVGRDQVQDELDLLHDVLGLGDPVLHLLSLLAQSRALLVEVTSEALVLAAADAPGEVVVASVVVVAVMAAAATTGVTATLTTAAALASTTAARLSARQVNGIVHLTLKHETSHAVLEILSGFILRLAQRQGADLEEEAHVERSRSPLPVFDILEVLLAHGSVGRWRSGLAFLLGALVRERLECLDLLLLLVTQLVILGSLQQDEQVFDLLHLLAVRDAALVQLVLLLVGEGQVRVEALGELLPGRAGNGGRRLRGRHEATLQRLVLGLVAVELLLITVEIVVAATLIEAIVTHAVITLRLGNVLGATALVASLMTALVPRLLARVAVGLERAALIALVLLHVLLVVHGLLLLVRVEWLLMLGLAVLVAAISLLLLVLRRELVRVLVHVVRLAVAAKVVVALVLLLRGPLLGVLLHAAHLRVEGRILVELRRRRLEILIGLESGRRTAEAAAWRWLRGCGRGTLTTGSPRLGVDIHAIVRKTVRYHDCGIFEDFEGVTLNFFRATKKHVKNR